MLRLKTEVEKCLANSCKKHDIECTCVDITGHRGWW